MNLVWKENPRGRFVRRLSFTEKEAVLNVCSNGSKPGQADIILADAVFEEMNRAQLVIECDCTEEPGKQMGPYNSLVNKQVSRHLRHMTTSSAHDAQCPLFRLKREKDADDAERIGNVSPLNPIGGNDWLPARTEEGRVQLPATAQLPASSRKKQLKPVPALGRKLLTLIQAAGLNQLELVPACQPPGLNNAIAAINEVLNTCGMSNGTPLSALFSCTPWLSKEKINAMLLKLESSEVIQADNQEACVYILGLAKTVSSEEAVFSVCGDTVTHRPSRRIKINGENTYNCGSRAPYWVVLAYRRNREGEVYCDEGYAHAAYAFDNPVPMDSNKERNTLKVIINACKYAGQQPSSPRAVSLSKPLFTFKTSHEGVEENIHPDFILKVVPAGKNQVTTLIVETMGNDSEEYITRKSRTHSFMKQEGTLLTDPPGWPDTSDVNFNRLLLANIFKVGK